MAAHLRTPRIEPRYLGAGLIALTLPGLFAIAPLLNPQPSASMELDAYIAANAQGFELPTAAATATGTTAAPLGRDGYGATPGAETFIAGGTNHDWAKLVLLYGGWPITENNTTVILRWMRQENYVDNWWNRNNPLNLGAGGYAAHATLAASAQQVAKTLSTGSGYREIVASFAASAPTEVTEHAIWYSPWATGHYNDGAHWHYTPVEVVQAPASAWGR